MRNVGCRPLAAASALVTRGWAGSLRTGRAPLGPGVNSTPNVSHPVWPDEKSGGAVFCCAAAPAVSATQARAVQMPLQSNFAREPNADMVLSSCSVRSELALSTSFFAGSVFQGVHRVALRVGLFLLLILCPCYSFVTPEVVRPQRPGGVNRRGRLGAMNAGSPMPSAGSLFPQPVRFRAANLTTLPQS